ncbi:MAG: MptD family putative ECF transporter S component [Chloroflexota bacterium]
MNLNLTTRDLITIGIFSAIILFVYIFLSGALFTPLLQILMMPIGALLLGPVYMLYIARTQKLGALTITALLIAILTGLIVYGSIVIALVNLVIGLLAELFAYIGGYKSFRWNTLSYITMSMWPIGQQGGIWFAKDWLYALTVTSGYPEEFAAGYIALGTPLNLALIIVSTVICGLISTNVAQGMLKRHFRRAGIA